MLKNPALIQAIGEAVIPVLGFFFFEWGLYFILLFYFFDLLATEVFVYIKAQKIARSRSNQSIMKHFVLLSGMTTLLLLFLSHISMLFIQPNITFYDEFIAFLLYEEAGIPIPQGVILLPLILLGNLQQYTQFFVRPQKHLFFSIDHIYKLRLTALLVGIAGCGLAIGGAVLLHLNETVLLLLLVVSKFFVDFKLRV